MTQYSQAGRSYLLSPTTPSPIRLQALNSKNIDHIQGTLADFTSALNDLYPGGLPPSNIADGGLSPTTFDLSSRDIEALRSVYPISRNKLISSAQYKTHNRREVGKLFYEGYGPNWHVILGDIHVPLRQYQSIVLRVHQALEDDIRAICLTGEAGSGKSTLSYVAALAIAEAGRVDVYEYRDDSTSIRAVFSALKKYNEEVGRSRMVILIDNLHLYSDELREVLHDSAYNFITLLTSCRQSEWASRIATHLPNDTLLLNLDRFSEQDIPQIIDKVSQYMASPRFTRLSQEDRVKRFLWSRRQLLIALREATESQKFEDIIKDELASIQNRNSIFLLGLIAWATVARAGIQDSVLASVYGMRERDESYADALSRLAGVVNKSGKARYIARHQVYADQIVREFVDIDLLHEVIDGVFAYFSQYEMPVIRQVNKSDGQLFKYTVNNFTLYNFFGRYGQVDDGLRLYQKYLVEFQLDGHYWLQLGLYQRRAGRQQEAFSSFQQSISAYEDNPFAHHAFAHQKLIVASVAGSYGLRERRYVDEAVEYLIGRHYAQSARPHAVEFDEYPIVTLGMYHIDVLMKHGLREEAVEAARKYFRMAEAMRADDAGNMVEQTKVTLLKFVTNGEWAPLRHHLGELNLR